jgi:peroxiredoxin Q/BCP
MGSRLAVMTAITVAVGARAPGFSLESDAGANTTLGDFAGQWLVLYFYPRDSTPGCTREAQAFTQAAPHLAKLHAAVLGVSKDSVKSHGSFRDKFKIGFPLLSDPDLVAHRAYGAWGKKMMYGKEIEGTLRSTFLIKPDGTLARSWSSVKVDGHADAVLEVIRELSGGAAARSPAARTATKATSRKPSAASAKTPAPKKTAAKAKKAAPASRKPAVKARKKARP